MVHTKAMRIFFKCFYYCGFSPFSSTGKYPYRIKSSENVLTNVPLLLHLAVVFGMTISSLIALNITVKPFTSNETVIINVILICDIARTILILVRFTHNKTIIYEILQIFHELDAYFRMHFLYRMPHETFRRRYMQKVLTVVMVTILYWVLYILICILRNRFNPWVLQFHTLQAITYASILHTAFYVDRLRFYIDQLIVVMERDAINHNSLVCVAMQRRKTMYNLGIRDRINCYKNVHFRLWEIGQKINMYFGWCAAAQFLHLFIDFINSSYKFLARLMSNWPFLTIMCRSQNIRRIHCSGHT